MQKQNPAGQTTGPAVPCPAPGAFDKITWPQQALVTLSLQLCWLQHAQVFCCISSISWLFLSSVDVSWSWYTNILDSPLQSMPHPLSFVWPHVSQDPLFKESNNALNCLAFMALFSLCTISHDSLVLHLSYSQNQYRVDDAAKFYCQLNMNSGPQLKWFPYALLAETVIQFS